MPLPYRSSVISVPVEQAWTVVREFNGLPAWHPAIEASSLDLGEEGQVGAVRRLTLASGGGVVVERLITLDDANHRLTYTILESPFAVRRYVSTMHLSPVTDDGATFMEWFAEFDSEAADEADLMVLFGDGVFAGGIEGLRDHLSA